MLERPVEYRKMAQVEGTHWWYRSLHSLVAQALARYALGRHTAIVDAGCGTGGLLRFLAAKGFCDLQGFDLSLTAVDICRERGLNVFLGNLLELPRILPRSSAQVIISNDTLYFFPPPGQAQILKSCWDALSPGGLLLLNVPASRAFRGIHDLAVGIEERFSKPAVFRLLRAAGFQVLQARSWPFLLSPFIWAIRAAQRLRLRRALRSDPSSDLSLPPLPVNVLLSGMTALECWLPPRAPFASSLFIVAQKL